jgi:hypothetical protein
MGAMVQPAIVYCQHCGAAMDPQDRFCRKCGWDSTGQVRQAPAVPANVSEKKRLAAALLCIFLGWLGVHRFYAGKVGTGLLWLFTVGLLGLGVIADLILILAGEFKDSEGRKIYVW